MCETEKGSVASNLRVGDDTLNAECHECGKKFDFSSYLDKNSKESFFDVILREAADGKIICPKCKKLNREILEAGKFEWVAKGPGSVRFADLELISEDGKKAILKLKKVEEDKLVFSIARSDFVFK